MTFRIEGEILAGSGVDSGEGYLDVLGGAGGKDELTEVEVERACSTEATGWLSLCDCSNQSSALGDGDRMVWVINGFGDRGFNLLAGFGGGGA